MSNKKGLIARIYEILCDDKKYDVLSSLNSGVKNELELLTDVEKELQHSVVFRTPEKYLSSYPAVTPIIKELQNYFNFEARLIERHADLYDKKICEFPVAMLDAISESFVILHNMLQGKSFDKYINYMRNATAIVDLCYILTGDNPYSLDDEFSLFLDMLYAEISSISSTFCRTKLRDLVMEHVPRRWKDPVTFQEENPVEFLEKYKHAFSIDARSYIFFYKIMFETPIEQCKHMGDPLIIRLKSYDNAAFWVRVTVQSIDFVLSNELVQNKQPIPGPTSCDLVAAQWIDAFITNLRKYWKASMAYSQELDEIEKLENLHNSENQTGPKLKMSNAPYKTVIQNASIDREDTSVMDNMEESIDESAEVIAKKSRRDVASVKEQT